MSEPIVIVHPRKMAIGIRDRSHEGALNRPSGSRRDPV
jgi:hypothetical protein